MAHKRNRHSAVFFVGHPELSPKPYGPRFFGLYGSSTSFAVKPQSRELIKFVKIFGNE